MPATYRTRRSIPEGFRAKLVLVIDDDQDIQKLLRDVLERDQYDVALATTAEDGLELARNIKVDLLISDIFMHGQGGLWAIKSIKEQDPELKVIAMSGGWSGLSADQVIRAATKVGADHGMTKPFDLKAFKASVEQLIGPALEVRV